MVGADRIGMPAIGSFGNKGSWLYGFQAIDSKASADPKGAYKNILIAKINNNPSNPVTALMRVEGGNNFLFHYYVFGILLMRDFIIPFIKTTSADG